MNKRANLYLAALLGATTPLLATPALAAQNYSQATMQQQNSCKGNVKDSNGEPIIGATIRIEGKTGGTVTDIDGNFTLENVKTGAKITISSIGCKSKTIVWKGGPIQVTMQNDTNVLQETVVVGYGVQKKANLTGSVSAITAKDIEGVPVANTATLLQGRMTGVNITMNGAQAGDDNPEIRVRGVGTFGNSNPMVLIDGVEGTLSQLSDISPADIENISVLKDAASAAIYGVRAANGVILITTKKGSAGSIKVNYGGSYSIQSATVLPKLLDSYNWAVMRNEINPGTYDQTALNKLKDGSDPEHYANTDWIDEVMQTGHMQQHSLSVSGGSENIQFMTSINYSDQKGIMKETGVRKLGFRSNVNSKYKRFSFGLNLAGNFNDVTAPGRNIGGEGGVMRLISWFARPTVPSRYNNGHYGYVDGSIKDAEAFKNPLEGIYLGYNKNNAWRFNGKATIGIDIYDGLKFQTSYAYTYYNKATKSFSPSGEDARYDAEGNMLKVGSVNNQLTDYRYRETMWTNENILTYNKRFGLHTINALAGHSVIGYDEEGLTASKQGFPTNNIYELDGGTKNPNTGGNAGAYRLQSFFGRLQYDYDNKYLFEFNIRRDGSSRMPKAHRYATFPSVSLGWVFTSEKFMEEQSKWLFGKLRFSWGKLGNQEIGNYPYTATYAANGNYYFDQSGTPQAGLIQSSVPNENIKWETTRSVNIGIDLGFFNNKITTSFDWFDRKTSDILMQLSMPGMFLGSLSAPYQNVGEVRNRGWEWSANYQDHSGDFGWYAGFNVTHVKNKILYMGGLNERISGSTINRVGDAIGAYYAYKAVGIYRTEADLNRTNAKGEKIMQNGIAPKLGDIMYQDTNNDGNITPDDRVIIGNPFPKYSFGFNLGGTWKNFDLSTLWQGVTGIYRYNWESTSDWKGNRTDRWLDRWSESNPNGSMPRLGYSLNDSYSSFWLSKADYLRLKNLEVGYTFNQLAKWGVSKIRVYFAATNLLTITSLDNYDPEKTGGDSRNDIHPNMKSVSFGVNINF
ncbi:TonB-dependent receptor [uncultured Prevotella sp.]|uniref:SusC/RagA family TonB-linked outer membrane protein n=1 Tax=uncultured Prevotella sp. TaxID=159272 RepID=UPI0026100BA8|nr:TonB-dependent receptor [uncultured Prevotella sp.]